MAKPKVEFTCVECGHSAPKWMGRCSGCGEWNTYIEALADPVGSASLPQVGEPALPVAQLHASAAKPTPTGVEEFDRVLGGGLVRGSVTLVGGEPGIGKSTLLAQVCASRAASGERVLYISAEESPQQVSARLERLGATPESLWVGGEPSLDRALSDIAAIEPTLVVIDSIQTIFDAALGSAPGSVAQVRHCAHRLTRIAKQDDVEVVLVGQVTKDGGLAGPRVLEHLVDTVISFDGDRDFGLRLLRATKHRFGPTGEIGVFEMTSDGLRAVGDPSGMLLRDRNGDVPGSVITVTSEGYRALVIEIQALVTGAAAAVPRRFSQGIDQARVAMLLAVLAQRGRVKAIDSDVYTSIVGGIHVQDPGADLAVVAALASAVREVPIDAGTAIIGEVGLAGEIRSVPFIERRLSEASRLGFARAIVPMTTDRPESADAPNGHELEVVRVATVSDALAAVSISHTG